MGSLFVKKEKDPDAIEYFMPHDKPYGSTFGRWTVKWWQWLLSIPKDDNPAMDNSGVHGFESQGDENVWFLAGTFVTNSKLARRKVAIPSGRAILFPTICYECNFLEDPIFRNEHELKAHVTKDIDDIVESQASVDGIDVEAFRVGSEPTLFPVNISNDIPHGVNGIDSGNVVGPGGATQSVSDGYWVFLKPMSLGRHEIHFKGSCSAGTRKTEAFYDILISD